jgi:hypothetical protein
MWGKLIKFGPAGELLGRCKYNAGLEKLLYKMLTFDIILFKIEEVLIWIRVFVLVKCMVICVLGGNCLDRDYRDFMIFGLAHRGKANSLRSIILQI